MEFLYGCRRIPLDFLCPPAQVCRQACANNLQDHPVLDILMLAIGLGFFAIALAYVTGCERL
jgi:hypothetical protein